MLTVACVLRSGGVYDPTWVWALKRNLNEQMAAPFRFLVLSDCSCFPGPIGVLLKYPWSGWWAKLELFRPDVFPEGPVLYLDLDTLVTGPVDHFAAYTGAIAMVSDFYRPQFGQSGVMLFNPGEVTAELWARFSRDPAGESMRIRDDGQWIYRTLLEHHHTPDRLQALFPGQVVSYKVDGRLGPPLDARLVAFHGRPKQNEPESGWAHERWLGLMGGVDVAP